MRKLLFCLLFTSALFFSLLSEAQTSLLQNSRSLRTKTETLSYSVYFRWAFIKGEVGIVHLINRPSANKGYFSQLLFNTVGLGEQFYPMRDTLEAIYSSQKNPLRFEQRVMDNGFRMTEEVTMLPTQYSINVRYKQSTPSEIRVDTLFQINTPDAVVVDMLSVLALIRSIDLSRIKVGHRNKFIVPAGKDLVYADYELSGYEQIESTDGEMLQTARVDISVNDKAFQNSKKSLTVWLSKDDDLIPIIIKSKLKVGYAECKLLSYRKE